MTVNVKLMSLFARYLEPFPNGRVELQAPATVRTLAERLGLPIPRVRIITVNGKQETLDSPLAHEDLVYIFPPAIGGG
jgi:molybdopterin converting factor small subunit